MRTLAARKRDSVVLAVLPVLQLLSGALAFAAWAVLSHNVGARVFADASLAYSWGVAAALPLTLGLPFLLPNFRRGAVGRQPSARTSWSLRTLSRCGVSALVLGWLAALAIVLLPTHPPQRVSLIGPAATLAGYGCLATTLQVQARLHRRSLWMLFAVTTGAVLPVTWLCTGLLRGQRIFLATTLLAALGFGLARLVKGTEVANGSDSEQFSRRSILRTALPLIPHMLAIALMTQGMRIAGSWSPQWSPEELRTLSGFTIILGLGFAVVSGVHGLMAVSIQQDDDQLLRKRLNRFAGGYAILGAASSAGVMFFLTTPLLGLLNGVAAPSLANVSMLGLVPPLLSSYFFVSTLLVRRGHTGRVALVSTSAAVSYIATSLAFPDPAHSVPVYALTFAVMPIAALVVAASVTHEGMRIASLLPLVGLMPAVLTMALGALLDH